MTLAPNLDKLVGRPLGEFVLRERIGEGGFGAVYRAIQPALDREAVVKVLHAKLRSSPAATERFLREAKLASKLDHPYAAHVYAFGAEPDGELWIAMELVRGTTLDQVLKSQGPIPLERLVPLLERICEVVHTAHERGIIHRDLKPANVMVLARAGRLLPKLLDFGIAKLAGQGELATAETVRGDTPPDEEIPRLTQDGVVMGSPLYMAPEQWLDAGDVRAQSDLYAIGVLAYEALTGKPPFTGANMTMIAMAHATKPPPPLGPGFPPALDQVLATALAKDPKDRYPDALAFASALRAAAAIEGPAQALPALEPAVHDAMLGGGPQPIADAIAALDAARNAHQARDALFQLARTVVRYLGLLALASRSRVSGGDDPPLLAELLRTLHRRVLGDREWIELVRELTRPWLARRDAYPVPELVDACHGDAATLEALAATLALRDGELPIDEQVAQGIAAMSRAFAALQLLCDYQLVVAVAGSVAERWTGVRRAQRATVAVRGKVTIGVPVLVDGDGAPVLELAPLFQIAASTPGAPLELFMFEGRDARGAKLVARPLAFEHHDDALWDWLRLQLASSAELAERDAFAERAPYRGLSAFSSEDGALFFGREKLVDAFVNRLRVRPLLVVVGRSGAGKSSFVQAGVIPALPPSWRALTMRPGASPMGALVATLQHAGLVVDRAAIEGNSEALGELLRADAGEHGTIVIVVDQLEELFTLCQDHAERERFTEALAAATRSEDDPVRVVFTLRDDFLLRTEQLPALRQRIEQGLQLLAVPAPNDLVRILVEPARRLGYEFDDPALPAAMVAEVADQPGALALLSFTGAKLWELRDRHFKQLTTSAYKSLSGVGGALARHAETTLEGMRPEERRLTRDAFRHLVTTESSRAVLSRKDLSTLLGGGEHGARVIEKLVAARLLVASENEAGEDTIEIIHEALLGAWPRLVEWRREDQQGARLVEQLRAAAKQWDDRGRPEGLLWRGEALADYTRWRTTNAAPLPETEQAFASASVTAASRSARLRRALVVGGVTVLAVGLIVMATLRQRAAIATREAEDRLIASYIDQARTKLEDGRHWEALANIVAAQKLGASGLVVDTMRALARAPARLLDYRIDANHGRTWSVRYSPDGSLLASAGEDGAALWRASNGQLVAPLHRGAGTVRDAVFDPAGTRVATIGFDGSVRIYEVPSGRELRVMHHQDIVRCVDWQADGRWLVTGSEDATLRVWDPSTGAARMTIPTEQPVRACRFAGHLAVAGTVSGQVIVATPDDGTTSVLGRHAAWARAVGVTAAGDRIVTASTDGDVRVWASTTGKQVATLRGASDILNGIEFSPDGAEVVAAGRDQVTRVWQLSTGMQRLALPGQGAIWSAEYSPDGRWILTCDDSGTARLWDARTGATLAVLEGHSAAVFRAVFSPDGEHIATASYDGTIAVWHTHELSTTAVAGIAKQPCQLSASIDGSRIAVACAEQTRIWDASADRTIAVLPGSENAACGSAFAVTASDKLGHSWNLATGRAVADLPDASAIGEVAAAGDRFAIVDRDTVRFVDASGAPERTVAASADWVVMLNAARWLYTSGSTLHVLDGATEVAAVNGGRTDQNIRVAVSSTGRFAVAGLKSAWLGNLDGSPALVPLFGHQAAVIDASFDATGSRLVTTSQDGSAIVWDAASGRLLHRLTSRSVYFAAALFDPTGALVVALDGDGALQLFDAATGDVIGTVGGHLRLPTELVRAADGSYVAYAGFDEVVRWKLEPDRDALAAAERELACKAPPHETIGICR